MSEDPDILAELETFAEPDVYEQLATAARARRAIAEVWYPEFEAATQKTIQRVMTGQLTPAEAGADLADTVALLRQRYG